MSYSISVITPGFKGKNLLFALLATVLVVVMLTLAQDYMRARLQQTGYYFSESLLFTSFYWLFVPFWFAQYLWIQYNSKSQSNLPISRATRMIGMLVLPVGLHLLLFPALVWVISAISFDHTFLFGRTLKYTVSEHLYLLFAFYSLPVLFSGLIGVQKEASTIAGKMKIDGALATQTIKYPENLWVETTNHSKIAVAITELAYCTSNTPYVNLHVANKKYLYASTIKAIEGQLDPGRFIRIHKTTLVNIQYVVFVKSRQNGDYDITLKNGDVLRVSRHYAAPFKARMEASSLGLG